MIVDTSALVAILFKEPEQNQFIAIINGADQRRLSTAGMVEMSMVLAREFGSDAGIVCDQFLRETYIVVEPVTVEHARLASQAFLKFGKGRHPAGLNFGDCFSYALSKATVSRCFSRAMISARRT